MFPQIKDSISVLYRKIRDGYEVNFLFNASSLVLPFHLNKEAFDCLEYLDGLHSIEEIAEKALLPIVEVKRLVLALQRSHILTTKKQPTIIAQDRFATQRNFFAEFETRTQSREVMQDRLHQARVAIIGLGGIGTWVAQGLALAGVRNFTLIDPDVVEISNLNRQCLFNVSDVGALKVQVAEQKLCMIEPEISVRSFAQRVVSSQDCLEEMRGSSIIISCADDPSTDAVNQIVTEVGFELQVPHILCGGYDGHLSFIGPTVIPGKSACWYCYEHALDKQLHRAEYQQLTVTNAHSKGGNIAAISAITANYHVLDALKVITGFLKPTMTNKAAELDFRTYDINFRKFRKRHTCPYCGQKRGES
jgi:molybdopterin-synthase adenylyltransferase